MKPATSQQAGMQTRYLLVRTLPGSRRGTVRAHLARAELRSALQFTNDSRLALIKPEPSIFVGIWSPKPVI